MVPVLRSNEACFGGDVVLLIVFGGTLDVLCQKFATPIAMKLEFFDPLGERPKITIKPVLFFAGDMQVTISAGDKESVPNTADNDESEYGRKNLPGQPAEV